MTLKWRQTSSGRQSVEMQLVEAITTGGFCLVLIWCTWWPQSVNAAGVSRLDTNGHAPQKHAATDAHELAHNHGVSYRQANYDYDEEENEDEEAEEELEASINGDTQIGGANVETVDENNTDDDEEEEEEDYEEDDEDNGVEEGRAAKRKYLIEKFMGIKV